MCGSKRRDRRKKILIRPPDGVVPPSTDRSIETVPSPKFRRMRPCSSSVPQPIKTHSEVAFDDMFAQAVNKSPRDSLTVSTESGSVVCSGWSSTNQLIDSPKKECITSCLTRAFKTRRSEAGEKSKELKKEALTALKSQMDSLSGSSSWEKYRDKTREL